MSNTLYLISGPSGSGKTTLMRSIMDIELVSFTTRQMRPGEVNGRDYIFITTEEFEALRANDGLMELSTYGGNHYGLTRKEFETKISYGDAFFICDFPGMKQMKEIYDKCKSIFIHGDKDDLRQRMISRGDSEAAIEKRLNTYEEEMLNLIYYDEVVKNEQDDFEYTRQILEDIIWEDK